MKHPTKKATRSIAWLLAILTACLAHAPIKAVNAIHDSSEVSKFGADEIAHSRASAAADAATQLKIAEAYGRAPLSFEANVGQTDDARVKFLARGNGYNLYLTSTEAMFAFFDKRTSSSATKETARSVRGPIELPSRVGDHRAGALRISLPGANKAAKVKAVEELPGRSNYFIGSDPGKWRVNVPTYSRVEYESIHRGVDLVYYGDQRQLEYDFRVAPGASYKVIKIRFDGGDKVSLNDDGDLVIETGGGKVYQRRPVAYQEANGIRETIAARYIVSDRREVGFEIGAYDANRSLIIDPVFSYSTYLGTAALSSVGVDRARNAYVTGTLPLDNFGRSFDAFVIKLNREGAAVLYSTFLGGSDRGITQGIQNQCFDIAVDSNGDAYVTGSTDSKDFPTTPGAFQKTLPGTIAGRRAAFVTKLNSTGDALIYSTYLGGTDNFSNSSGQAIAVDEEGSAYVTGSTDSFKFPLASPVQSINRGGSCASGDVIVPCQNEAFVSKLNRFGSALIYSTYLGGEGNDSGGDIAVDGAGSAYVVGTTSGSNFSRPPASGFPTMNPLQPARGGGSSDLFITKLNVAGNELVYSTFLGGSGGDAANGVAVDSSGDAYVAGRTYSTDFPTTPGALQGANASSTAFKSTDGGTTWSAINRGLPGADLSVEVAVDPIDASTLYAISGGGLFKSTDGGNNWRLLRSGFISKVVIDPTNPSTLYAGSRFFSGGLEKSTDGGKTWREADFGLTPNIPIDILIDPKDPAMLYAAALLIQDSGQGVGIFKSTNGGINWVRSVRGVSRQPIIALALAPSKPKRLYAFSGGSIFKSTNSGKKWTPGGFSSNLFAASLAVDPFNPNTVYLGTRAGVSKSNDGAETWASTPLRANISLLVVDPKNPSVIYAAGGDPINLDRNFKSTDGGGSWKAIGRISANFVATFAIDPNNTSIVYAGTIAASPFVLSADAFVAKINPTGAALVYSTYLGGNGDDIARGITVDAQGDAYLTGQTSSEDFLIKSALQPRKPGSPTSYDVFLTKLDPSGSPIYSSYLGGSSNDEGRAIALDDAGGLYIVGRTDSDDFPAVNPIQRTRNGAFNNGFVTKLVDSAVSSARILSRKGSP